MRARESANDLVTLGLAMLAKAPLIKSLIKSGAKICLLGPKPHSLVK